MVRDELFTSQSELQGSREELRAARDELRNKPKKPFHTNDKVSSPTQKTDLIGRRTYEA